MGADNSIRAVFKAIPDANHFTVTFMDKRGKVLKSEDVEQGKSASPPGNVPYLPGYEFMNIWDKDYTNVTSDLTIKARYQRTAGTYTLTVEGGKLSTGGDTGDFQFDMPVTVVADPAPEGKKFSHWVKKQGQDQNGKKVSTQSTYSFFTPMNNATLKAEYVDEDALIMEWPFITLELLQETDAAIAYTAHRNVPDDYGYSLMESGVILIESSELDADEELTVDTSGAVIGRIKNDSTDQFYIYKNKVGKTWTARAYLIYRDEAGNIVTVYSEQL